MTTHRHHRHWDFEEGFLAGCAATGAVLVGVLALPVDPAPPPRFSTTQVDRLPVADPARIAGWELARALAEPAPLAWDACQCERPPLVAGGL